MTNATDATRNIAPALFANLSPRQRAALVKLMARIAERAYRRGANQGVHAALTQPQTLPRDMWRWRYGHALDRAPSLEQPSLLEDADDRLFMENPGLMRLGFERPGHCPPRRHESGTSP